MSFRQFHPAEFKNDAYTFDVFNLTKTPYTIQATAALHTLETPMKLLRKTIKQLFSQRRNRIGDLNTHWKVSHLDMFSIIQTLTTTVDEINAILAEYTSAKDWREVDDEKVVGAWEKLLSDYANYFATLTDFMDDYRHFSGSDPFFGKEKETSALVQKITVAIKSRH